ncbi:hypothetical protein [Streptomyces sp. NPDC004435]|uniref:hypothetical protein n=1 Tax=Streptomyces sp. NPDC004435 TaxID=3364701 RepID=UPI0036AB1F32
MNEHQEEAPAWVPTPGEFAIDRAGKVGMVTDRCGGLIYLCPPGGGRLFYRWPEDLRGLTATELRAVEEPLSGVAK